MVTQGIQDQYTHPHSAETKKTVKMEVQKCSHPQRESDQSMKPTSVKEPSFMNNLVFDQRKQTKELFSLWMKSMSSSKAILFLAFQIIQKMHKGPTLYTSFLFFPTNDPSQPKSVALTEDGNTQCTPKIVKNISYEALVLTHWRRM